MESRCISVALATGIGQVENSTLFPGSLLTQRRKRWSGLRFRQDISFKTCTDTRNRSCFVSSAKNGIGKKFKFFSMPRLWVSAIQAGRRRWYYHIYLTSRHSTAPTDVGLPPPGGWFAGLSLRQPCQQGSSTALLTSSGRVTTKTIPPTWGVRVAFCNAHTHRGHRDEVNHARRVRARNA